MDNNVLSQLKPIHLPHMVSLFPLAYGWYMLLIIFIIFMVLLVWKLIKYHRRQKNIKYIYSLLLAIQSNQNIDDQVLAEVSILLKRVARMRFPEQHPQRLFGYAWLQFLDQTGKTNHFTSGVGMALANIYQHNILQIDKEEFLNLIKAWIKVVI